MNNESEMLRNKENKLLQNFNVLTDDHQSFITEHLNKVFCGSSRLAEIYIKMNYRGLYFSFGDFVKSMVVDRLYDGNEPKDLAGLFDYVKHENYLLSLNKFYTMKVDAGVIVYTAVFDNPYKWKQED